MSLRADTPLRRSVRAAAFPAWRKTPISAGAARAGLGFYTQIKTIYRDN
jgi:hypothetical protein